MGNAEYELIGMTPDKHYAEIKLEDGYFIFGDMSTPGKPEAVTAPNGGLLRTSYKSLADKILEHLDEYGPDCMSVESILPWHFTMCDNFSHLEHEELEKIMIDSFIKRNDWTYELAKKNAGYKVIFGDFETRSNEIKEWFKQCSHMQMTAACCIGNAYESVNVAFALAMLIEKCSASYIDGYLGLLTNAIQSEIPSVSNKEIYKAYENFFLYYGIHLKEDGTSIDSDVVLDSTDLIKDIIESYANSFVNENYPEHEELENYVDLDVFKEKIIDFCDQCYEDEERILAEYLVSAYFDAFCVTCLHKTNPESFTREDAYKFLQSKCNTEYCDIYSDRLLGLEIDGAESKRIWSEVSPFVQMERAFVVGSEGDADLVDVAMNASLKVGTAAACKYFKEYTDESIDCDFVGMTVDEDTLLGRNFKHYINYHPLHLHPFSVEKMTGYEFTFQNDEEEINHNGITIKGFINNNCWIKKICIIDEENVRYHNLILFVENDVVSNVYVLNETQEMSMSNSLFYIPGMPSTTKSTFEYIGELEEKDYKELLSLKKGNCLKSNNPLVGRIVPDSIIKEKGERNTYSLTMQSVHRQAYVGIDIYCDDNQVIQNIDFTAYKSSGSGYWDMFTRPRAIADNLDEIIDAMLYIQDMYDEE